MTTYRQLQRASDTGFSQSWGDRLVNDLKSIFAQILQGDFAVGGKLISQSGRITNVRLVTATPDTLKLTDERVDVNVASAVAMTLPANPNTGQEIIVQDSGGNATVNVITISAPGGVTLNGVVAGNLKIDIPYHSRRFLYNGSQWIGS